MQEHGALTILMRLGANASTRLTDHREGGGVPRNPCRI